MTSSAQALRFLERRQEVVSNNLANASTDGFKGERTFGRLLEGSIPVVETQTDMRAGTMRPTGAPLDLALGGEGFLVVEGPEGERLTRGGAFRLDDMGRVVNASGLPLLGEGGPIVIDPQVARGVAGQSGNGDGGAGGAGGDAVVRVDRGGGVHVNGTVVGSLRVESVPPGAQLEHVGGGLFLPPAVRAPVAADARDVRQGFLEESNVTPVSALVEMISVQRAYANVQKVMTTLDAARGTTVTDIGRPV
ncbi:MAG: flagellar hook-basal body protein [Gemmatimonadaceae bacterium]